MGCKVEIGKRMYKIRFGHRASFECVAFPNVLVVFVQLLVTDLVSQFYQSAPGTERPSVQELL